MRRKLLALIGATAVALVGTAVFAAGTAQAATSPQLPKLVTFSENDCTGTKVVTLTNPKFSHVGLVFNVDGTAVAVDNDSVKTVTIEWPESAEITVTLVGGYVTPTPGPTLLSQSAVSEKSDKDFDLGPWYSEWEWSPKCLDVSAKSTCDNKYTVTVINTSPAPGEFGLQAGDADAVDVVIAGNATWTKTYAKGTTVTIITGEDSFKTFNFEQPDCSTPTPAPSTPAPTTSAPGPVLNGPDLPTTGDSLTKPAVSATAAIALGAILLFSMYLKRRRTAAEAVKVSPTNES